MARRLQRQPVDGLAMIQLPGRTLVMRGSVSDLGDELRLTWEVESGRDVLAQVMVCPRCGVLLRGGDGPEVISRHLLNLRLAAFWRP